MLLKGEGTPVKVGLRYTLIPNFPLLTVTSKSRNVNLVGGASSYVKRRLECWLLCTFGSSRVSLRGAVLKRYYPGYKYSML